MSRRATSARSSPARRARSSPRRSSRAISTPSRSRSRSAERPSSSRAERASYYLPAMTEMVQVALAGDVAEAEELQELLATAGIEAELEPEDEADALKVMVPAGSLEDAKDAIEALTEPDEPAVD